MSRPIALGKLMGFYSADNSNVSKNDTIIYGAVIVLASFLDIIVVQSFALKGQEVALKIRIAFSSLIYRKSLRLSKTALGNTTVGHIINLLSTDTHELANFSRSFHAIWAAPLDVVIILYLLYTMSGPTSLVGLTFIASLIPLQSKYQL